MIRRKKATAVQMRIFNGWDLKPIVLGEGAKRQAKEEKWKEENINGGEQRDKVSCRVSALKEAGLQRGSEQQRREQTRL